MDLRSNINLATACKIFELSADRMFESIKILRLKKGGPKGKFEQPI